MVGNPEDVPDAAKLHVLWHEVGVQAERVRRLEDATNARCKAHDQRVARCEERIEDLRLWRAKLMGAIVAAGGTGGAVAELIRRLSGGG